jgi:RNA polymerase-binding transcription factor DksA
MDQAEARERIQQEKQRVSALAEDLRSEGLDESEGDQLSELSAHDQHQAELGSETFEREKDISILESLEAELGDLEKALGKLDEGTYGICEACGKPIPRERLEAIPATRFCVKDQPRRNG